MNRFDQRQVTKWEAESKRLLPLKVQNDFTDAEPLIPSRDGFVLTQDDRLAFRFMLQSEAQKYGKDGLTPREAYALMGRLENLPAIEQVALDLQRDFVIVRRALIALYAAVSRKQMPTSKEIVDAARAIRETE